MLKMSSSQKDFRRHYEWKCVQSLTLPLTYLLVVVGGGGGGTGTGGNVLPKFIGRYKSDCDEVEGYAINSHGW
jgi:hypothetical protein